MENSSIIKEDARLLSKVILAQDFLNTSCSCKMEGGHARVFLEGKDQKQLDKTRKSFDQAVLVVHKMRSL